MGSLSRARLVIVLVTVGAIAGLALAGPAIGKKHPAPPKSYKGSGRSTYHSEDQACFGAKWSGTGRPRSTLNTSGEPTQMSATF